MDDGDSQVTLREDLAPLDVANGPVVAPQSVLLDLLVYRDELEPHLNLNNKFPRNFLLTFSVII